MFQNHVPGDAFVGVAGAPQPCSDHAERIAEFALAVHHQMINFKMKDGTPIQIRMGIHSGKVSAGVLYVTGVRNADHSLVAS